MSPPPSNPVSTPPLPIITILPAPRPDPADSLEFTTKTITFARTQTTWRITSRLSHYTPSDSFAKAALFRVELVGCAVRDIPMNVSKTAVVKVRAVFATRSKDRKFDIIPPTSVKEIRALQRLTLNDCTYAPKLIDAKVCMRWVRLDDGETDIGMTGEYVTYMLMTDMPGVQLTGQLFWDGMSMEERDHIRTAFRKALSTIHHHRVLPSYITERPDKQVHPHVITPTPALSPRVSLKNCVWHSESRALSIFDFENAVTFGAEEKGFPDAYRKWDEAWLVHWGLTKDGDEVGGEEQKGDEVVGKDRKGDEVEGADQKDGTEAVAREPKISGFDVVEMLVRDLEMDKEVVERVRRYKEMRKAQKKKCVVM